MSAGPFDRLREDHRRVLDETAAIEAAVSDLGPGGRLAPEAEQGLRALLALLEHQFSTHMRAEDEVVFPALLVALPEASASVSPLAAEHGELRAMLAGLLERLGQGASAARDEQVIVQVRDLADLLRIHIRKEEAMVLRIAERVLTPAEQARLESRDAADPTPHHPSRPPRDLPRGTLP